MSSSISEILRACARIQDPAPGQRLLNGVHLTRLAAACEGVCHACWRPIAAGEAYAVVRLGPGADPVERQRAREGRPYNAAEARIHWACATGEEG